jgi:hypothetical protein
VLDSPLAKEWFSRVQGTQRIVKLKGESFQRNWAG